MPPKIPPPTTARTSFVVELFFLGVFLVITPAGLAMADDPISSLPDSIRIATYNVSLYGKSAGRVRERLADGQDRQASRIAAVIQSVRPDILLINEVDYDEGGLTAKLFAEKFLAVGQHGREAMVYPFVYAAPSNTGIDSQRDLDGDGKTSGPADAWGFGLYPGQYAFALLSRFPIDEVNLRSFQNFLWKDFPGALRPTDPTTGKSFYTDQVWDSFRLSSKNHVDVPIQVGSHTLHLLASHPTPPVFDGPEDRNGCRNHDEVDFWRRYLNAPDATWLRDDSRAYWRLETKAREAKVTETKNTGRRTVLCGSRGLELGPRSRGFAAAGHSPSDR